MIDLTEQQEQEMIDLARTGDPKANYNMSLWALEQAMAEPEEERWNRLAAKCLVKAAEGGYAPAQERMKELLAQTAAAQAETPATQPTAPEPEPAPAAPRTAPAGAQARPAAAQTRPAASRPRPASYAREPIGEDPLAKVGRAVTTAAASVSDKVRSLTGGRPGAAGGKARAGGLADILNVSEWDAAKWKKVQRIGIIVCVVLVLLIIIMISSSRKKNRTPEPEEGTTIPAAEVVDTPAPSATPEPDTEAYPPAGIRTEIEAADLDVYPDEADFVTEATTATVSTSSGLFLRRGPGTTYNQVGSMDNRTSVNVYAYKNGWALVKHNRTWGWCSVDFLT